MLPIVLSFMSAELRVIQLALIVRELQPKIKWLALIASLLHISQLTNNNVNYPLL